MFHDLLKSVLGFLGLVTTSLFIAITLLGSSCFFEPEGNDVFLFITKAISRIFIT